MNKIKNASAAFMIAAEAFFIILRLYSHLELLSNSLSSERIE